jgi:hypothetical protein
VVEQVGYMMARLVAVGVLPNYSGATLIIYVVPLYS